MNSSLVPRDDDAQDLQQLSNSVKVFLQQEDQASLDDIRRRMENKPGAAARWFPTKAQRAIQANDVERIRASGEITNAIYETYGQLQHAIAVKESDVALKTLGIGHHSELSTFALRELNTLESNISACRTQFLANYVQAREECELYKDDPELYESFRESLTHQRVTFMDTMSSLLDGFRDQMQSQLPPPKK